MIADPALAKIALLRRESELHPGEPPRTLDGIEAAPGRWLLSYEEYLLQTERGLRFHYRRGAGVTAAVPPECTAAELELWRNGSVYAAIAALNGMVPLHASAVAHDGGVTAFTGPTGAGKSTLVAALGGQGFAMFCDDTLVLDLEDPAQITCLPGHKRLKLTEQALELTGARREEPVTPELEKYYAAPVAGTVDRPLPLRRLVFIEEGPELGLHPLKGAQCLLRLGDEHYTTALFEGVNGHDRDRIFAARARIAGGIEMFRLVRPRDPAQFTASVRLVAALLNPDE